MIIPLGPVYSLIRPLDQHRGRALVNAAQSDSHGASGGKSYRIIEAVSRSLLRLTTRC